MSKSIVIQEGGVGKNLTANKLKTNLIGGGTCLWVPEDETQLTTKHITKDGTYTASAEGYYGYSSVTVDGIGVATGKKPSGDEYSYSTDSTGYIVETKIPSSIEVTTPPTITTYGDGAYIGFDGIVVKAYDNNGVYMQDVPFSELTFPVTVARYSDEYNAYTAGGVSWIADSGYVFSEANTLLDAWGGRTFNKTTDGPSIVVHANNLNTWYGQPTDNPAYGPIIMSTDSNYIDSNWGNNAIEIEIDGVTWYFHPVAHLQGADSHTGGSAPTWNGSGCTSWEECARSILNAAGVVVISTIPPGGDGVQAIPVQWARPIDNKVLSTAFAITVIPAGGHGED